MSKTNIQTNWDYPIFGVENLKTKLISPLPYYFGSGIKRETTPMYF
jgi:hypothetical protein